MVNLVKHILKGISWLFRKEHHVIVSAFIFGLLVWVMDALLDHIIFYKGQYNFWEHLVLNPEPHEIYMRTFILLFFLLFGALLSVQLEKRRAESKKTAHLNQVLKAVRNVNQLIATEKDRRQLINRTCKSLVSTRGYFSAWIALFDRERQFEALAFCGEQKNYNALEESLKNGRLPDCAQKAFAKSEVVVTQNPSKTCKNCPLAAGYETSGALSIRLEHQGIHYGFITVAVPNSIIEDGEEISLFEDVARDIASALYDIEVERQREKAEKALKKSQERLQLAIDGANLGVWDWKPETGAVNFNKEWAEMLGYSLDEIVFHVDSWKNKVHPDDWPAVEQVLQAHLEGKSSFYESEHRMQTKDGSYKWVLDRGKVMERNDSGNPERVTGTHLDINERKQAEERIAYEKEKLRTLLHSIGDAVIATGTREEIIFMNPVAETLTGWQINEAAGKPLREVFRIFNAKTRNPVENPVHKVLETGKIVGLANHTFLISKQGTEYQIADSASPVRDKAGNLQGIVLVFRDITEDYRMREALRKSEKQLRKAQQIAGVGSWQFDLTAGTVTASREANEIYGIPKDRQFTIGDVQQIPLKAYRRQLDEALHKLIKGEAAYDVYFKIKRPSDGEIRYIHSIAEYDSDKHTVMGILQDVTRIKQAEEHLRHKNEELTATEEELKASNDELKAMNQKLENRNEELEKARKAAEEAKANLKQKNDELRAAEEELRASNDDLRDMNEQLEEQKEELKQAKEKAEEAEHNLKVKNEELEAAEEELRASNDELKDINQKLETQKEELKYAKERAEESDRLKTAFLANMSHEIRTPLNGILGFTGLLIRKDFTPEKRRQYVRVIDRNGRRMLTTINDLIDISKIETGQIETYITPVNINSHLDELYSFFKHEAREKGLEFLQEKELPDEEAVIQTDNEKLYAILSNLLKNAIKYTEKGTVVFGYQPEGQYIKFYVQDSGMGIPEERQKAVFERFVQADLHYAKAREGSGLGLSITKAYVEMLGGQIGLKSEEGSGSLFYFYIPRQ